MSSPMLGRVAASPFLSGKLSPFLFNGTTQLMLAQATNLGYALRGVARVQDTQPERKGDYWFRDFGMVMACAYMTQAGFLAVDERYSGPLIAKHLGLHRLSELEDQETLYACDERFKLYKYARNYDELPAVMREKVMGSLIKDTPHLVAQRLRQTHATQFIHPLPEGPMKRHLMDVLAHPVQVAESFQRFYQQFLDQHGLKYDAIEAISALENPARRESALDRLASEQTRIQPNRDWKAIIRQATTLQDTRQMGILSDHLQRLLNFDGYLLEDFLDGSLPMARKVGKEIQVLVDKLDEAYHRGRTEIPKLVDELRALPLEERKKTFTEKMTRLRRALYLKKGFQLQGIGPYPTSAENRFSAVDLRKFDEFQGTIWELTHEQDNKTYKAGLKHMLENGRDIYAYLAQPENKLRHKALIWQRFPHYFKSSLESQMKRVFDDIAKLGGSDHTAHWGQTSLSRHEQLSRRFDDFRFGPPEHPLQQKLDHFLAFVKAHFPDSTHEPVDPKTLTFIKTHKLKDFLKQELPHHTEEWLTPFLKPELAARLGQPGPAFGEGLRKMFDSVLRSGVDAKKVVRQVIAAQKSGTWPKMGLTVLLNLIFYGFAASNFDNKILQPYQQKLVAERGTSQPIVTAGYLALLPGAAVLTQLFDRAALPMFRKMGAFVRFSTVGGIALGVFGASTYGILQALLKKPPPPKPAPPSLRPAFSPLPRPGTVGMGMPPGSFGAFPAPFATAPLGSPYPPRR